MSAIYRQNCRVAGDVKTGEVEDSAEIKKAEYELLSLIYKMVPRRGKGRNSLRTA